MQASSCITNTERCTEHTCGTCCVPFMNKTILFCETKSSNAFRNSGFNPGAADTPAPKSPALTRTAISCACTPACALSQLQSQFAQAVRQAAAGCHGFCSSPAALMVVAWPASLLRHVYGACSKLSRHLGLLVYWPGTCRLLWVRTSCWLQRTEACMVAKACCGGGAGTSARPLFRIKLSWHQPSANAAMSRCTQESVALTLMSTCRGQGASEAADGGVDVHTGLLAESQLERSLVECQHSGFCSQPHQALCERSFIQYASGQCAARRHAEACRSDSLVPHDWQ